MSARYNRHGADLAVDANQHRAYIEDMERHTPTQGETQMTRAKFEATRDKMPVHDRIKRMNAPTTAAAFAEGRAEWDKADGHTSSNPYHIDDINWDAWRDGFTHLDWIARGRKY
jgi:hypothetical protein